MGKLSKSPNIGKEVERQLNEVYNVPFRELRKYCFPIYAKQNSRNFIIGIRIGGV